MRRLFAIIIIFACALNIAYADDISLLPKYGSNPKSEALQKADAQFIANIDETYKGDRKKAAEEVAAKGWDLLRHGDISNAMRRFNESWLINNTNGKAIWGMAVIETMIGKPTEAMSLFSEAEITIGQDIDFESDYAKAIGITGIGTKNDAQVEDAFRRFALVYEKAPEHVLNLQNWAITLFFVGNYAEAWKKIQLAEAAPRASELDQKFIAALNNKMPRP